MWAAGLKEGRVFKFWSHRDEFTSIFNTYKVLLSMSRFPLCEWGLTTAVVRSNLTHTGTQ